MRPKEKVAFWRDPEISGVEVCRVDESRHVFPEHAHEGIYVVGLMDRGSSYCLGPQQTDSLVAKGQIALINPGQLHSGVPYRGDRVSYRMFYFTLETMASAVCELSRNRTPSLAFTQMILDDPRLRHYLQRLFRIVGQPCDRLAKESVVMDTLVHLVAFRSNVDLRPIAHRCSQRTIDRAMDYLAADLDQKVSLATAAKVVGLSRYHFLRVFKRETGLSPHLFRTLRRIDRAKHHLRNKMSLSETALTVGFSDQSHFSNTFRKYTGATPGQYLASFS